MMAVLAMLPSAALSWATSEVSTCPTSGSPVFRGITPTATSSQYSLQKNILVWVNNILAQYSFIL